MQRASRGQFDLQAARYGSGHILRDVSDVADALDEFAVPELSPALDVATGAGHTAAYLGSRGFEVTGADISEGMLAGAPAEARRAFGLTEEDGEVVWWWPRLTLLARRPEVAKSVRET